METKIKCNLLLVAVAILSFSACEKNKNNTTDQVVSTETQTAKQEEPSSSNETAKNTNPIGTSSVSGVITFSGSAPKVTKNPAATFPDCSAPKLDPNQLAIRVNDGKLMNTFVYVKSGLPKHNYEVPDSAVTLDQQHCAYIPRVLGIQVGQPLEIVNSDTTLHNVHSLAKESAPFNLGMPKKGMKLTKTFEKTETMVTMKCDVHPWMRAYIGVLDHPFFSVSAIRPR